MPTRSALLAFGGTLPLGGGVVYTVPAGYTTIVKTISIDNSSGATVKTNVRIPTVAAGLIRRGWQLLTNTSDVWHTWFVLESGNTLSLEPDVAGAIRYTIHGAELID